MFEYDPDRIYQNINDDVTSGNITYIPGGFATVKKAVKTLSKKKHEWGVEVYEDNDFYRVVFEDALVVNVPRRSWTEFVDGMGLKEENGRYTLLECLESNIYEGKIDVSNVMKSDISEEWTKALDKILATFKGLLIRKGFSLFEKEVSNWKATFDVLEEADWSKSLLSYSTLREDMILLENRLKEEYVDDLGGLEILCCRLEEGNLDLIFDLMGDPNYLLSAHVDSKVNETDLRFEILMDKKFRLYENVFTCGGQIILESSGLKDFVIMKKIILPSNGLFGISGMLKLKQVAEGKYLEGNNG